MSDAVTRFNRVGLKGRKTQGPDPFIKKEVISLPLVASAAAQSTGVTLPTNAIVIDAVVHRTVASTSGTTETIDLGIVGNPDQLIDGAATDATGYVGPTGGAGEGSSIIGGQEIAYQLGSADIVGLEAYAVILYMGDDLG